MKKKHPKDNKFHKGNGEDGKHYWLTPDDLMKELLNRMERLYLLVGTQGVWVRRMGLKYKKFY